MVLELNYSFVCASLSLHTVSPSIFFSSEQEPGSQWIVRVCVLISPPCLRTWDSVLRLHTHLSVFAPSRTDTFPFFSPSLSSQSIFWFPLSLTVSPFCSFSHSSFITVDPLLNVSTVTFFSCLRQWHPLITKQRDIVFVTFYWFAWPCIWPARFPHDG